MSANALRFQLGPFFLSGAIQGAAKLYHFEAGTSTLKDLWTLRDKSITTAQPLVADANGIFNGFADGLYKLVICRPESTGPSDLVLYTLDNFQFLDPGIDTTFGEGPVIPSASTTILGDSVWAHISGTTNIAVLQGTVPFFWAVFDGALTLQHSASLICPSSIDLAVKAGDVVFFLMESADVYRVAAHYQVDGLLIATQDNRTNTVDPALTVRSTTSGTPAAGIGTGILLQAESTDENPSDVGQLEFAASDVGPGTEDTYFQILLRVAGAALTAAYRWVATSAFKAIFTHANTADRTYTLPDASFLLDDGAQYKGPTSTGASSTQAHEGNVTISASQALDGVHFYGNFTLDAGDTVTLDDNSHRLIIVCSGTLTINGTIDAVGAGSNGGARGVAAGTVGDDGFSQPGGGGGGSATEAGAAGGGVRLHGLLRQAGGAGGTATNNGTAGTSQTGDALTIADLLSIMGGAGGGGGVDDTGTAGSGGKGGGSIVLIAPTIILGASSVLNTSGAAGGNVTGDNGGGGGGGAGNVYMRCRSYTDNGATFTLAGGVGGGGGNNSGGAGAAGVRQIHIHA